MSACLAPQPPRIIATATDPIASTPPRLTVGSIATATTPSGVGDTNPSPVTPQVTAQRAETAGDADDPTAVPDADVHLDHFLLAGRPAPPHASNSVVASYRYGSTNEGRYDTHHGVEFTNPANTQLVAVAPATVFWAGDDAEHEFGAYKNFYGNLVVLRLDEAWRGHAVYVLYGHLLAVSVRTGQKVEAGDVLGHVGQSGIARGPHLHLEVRLDRPLDYGSTRNPELWLAPLPGTGAIAGQVLDSRARPIPNARVDIDCADGKFRFADTYHDDSVTLDEDYQENFAVGDVPVGWCELTVDYVSGTEKRLALVNEGATTFVVLRP